MPGLPGTTRPRRPTTARRPFAGVDDQWRARALVRLADLDLAAGNAKKALALYEAGGGPVAAPAGAGADATIAFGIAEADYELHKDAAAQAAFSVFLADYPDDPRRTLARVRLARCLERTGASLDDALAVVAPTAPRPSTRRASSRRWPTK